MCNIVLIQQLDISYKEQIQMRAKAVYITLGANNKNSSWWRGSFMFSFFFLSKFAVTFARARPAYLSSQLLLNTSPFSRARDFAQPACRLFLLLVLCKIRLSFYCSIVSEKTWILTHNKFLFHSKYRLKNKVLRKYLAVKGFILCDWCLMYNKLKVLRPSTML